MQVNLTWSGAHRGSNSRACSMQDQEGHGDLVCPPCPEAPRPQNPTELIELISPRRLSHKTPINCLKKKKKASQFYCLIQPV